MEVTNPAGPSVAASVCFVVGVFLAVLGFVQASISLRLEFQIENLLFGRLSRRADTKLLHNQPGKVG